MSGIPKADGSKIDLTKPGIYLCRVTRELALKWLDRNFANQPVQREHVRVIAAMILRGVVATITRRDLVRPRRQPVGWAASSSRYCRAGIPVLVRVSAASSPRFAIHRHRQRVARSMTARRLTPTTTSTRALRRF